MLLPYLKILKIFLTLALVIFSLNVTHAFAVSRPEALPQPAENIFELNNGNHQLFYTLFNSTFIPAQVASRYKLKRSKYQWLMNILVSKTGSFGGVPATLSGTQKNLFGQVKPLNFITIEEKDTVYYLVPIRISGEDILHFEITATPEDGEPTTIKFTDKVISD